MTTKPDKRCAESNFELERRYNKAIEVAVKLIDDFIPSSKTGNFDRVYVSSFDPMSVEEEIEL